MPHAQLVAGILTGSFALQLLLAAGGTLCIEPGHGVSAATDGASHSMPASGNTSHEAMLGGMGHGDGATSHDEAPCDQPSAPENCLLLTPCASAFAVTAIVGLDTTDGSPTRAATRPDLVPASRTTAPELPPPRA